MVKELVIKSRSYRRFHEDYKVDDQTMHEFAEIARYTPSGRNVQPLRFILSNVRSKNEKIFDTLSWAGYLKDWDGPVPGERPSAYFIILGDTRVSTNYFCDHGIVAQSVLLAATEKGLGGCIIATVNRAILHAALNIPAYYEILLVVAIGQPLEQVVIEEFEGDVKYWRDENQVHHVPKRSLDELILKI